MGSRDAVGLLALVLSLLSGGCRGEFVYADLLETSGDGDGDDSGENRLGNPSFESWNEDQLVVWYTTGDTTLIRSDEAVDGVASVIVTASDYSSLGQQLNFPDPLPAGTCVRAGATIRWLGGSGMAPAFLFTAGYTDETEELLGEQLSWIADEQWHASQTPQAELPKDTMRLLISIGNTTPESQSYGIDAAWLRVEPCD